MEEEQENKKNKNKDETDFGQITGLPSLSSDVKLSLSSSVYLNAELPSGSALFNAVSALLSQSTVDSSMSMRPFISMSEFREEVKEHGSSMHGTCMLLLVALATYTCNRKLGESFLSFVLHPDYLHQNELTVSESELLREHLGSRTHAIVRYFRSSQSPASLSLRVEQNRFSKPFSPEYDYECVFISPDNDSDNSLRPITLRRSLLGTRSQWRVWNFHSLFADDELVNGNNTSFEPSI